MIIHPHPLNHVRFRALPCTLRGAGPALSPVFAEAASRRQASRERGNWIESMSIFGINFVLDKETNVLYLFAYGLSVPLRLFTIVNIGRKVLSSAVPLSLIFGIEAPRPSRQDGTSRARSGERNASKENFILIVPLDPAYPDRSGRGTCRPQRRLTWETRKKDFQRLRVSERLVSMAR